MVVTERRMVSWGPSHRAFIHSIDKHLDAVASRNEAVVNEQHMRRVGRMASRIAVRLGMPPDDCYRIGEGGLMHDIGKSHPIAAAWLKRHEGVVVSDVEREAFRRLHTSLGKEMVLQVDMQGMVCSRDELELICLYHHDPYLQLQGRAKTLVPVIQAADAFDAMVTIDGGHSYTSIDEAEAMRTLITLVARGAFDSGAVEALVYCRGLRVG
jgi:response regulator RpfG family c-di-GMP phosphodiesterase